MRRRARVRGAVFGLERPERAERLVVRYGRRREVVDDSRRGSVDDVRGGRGARLGPRGDVQISEEPAGGGGEARRGVAVNREDSSASKPAPRRGRIAAPPRRRPRRRRSDRRHRYERAHVCRSCGWSVDAAARARALNAGGTEGRFSSCTSEGLDRDPRPAKTRAEVAHPPSPVPPHTASGDMLTASAIAHRPSLVYTRPTTRVIAHRRGPLTVRAYGEPGAMNDDARRRPSIQSMGSADRLEVMRAKPLFTIGLFADAQYADKDDYERPSEPGRVKYFRASATRLADAFVDFRAKGESMACIVNLGDLIDGYNDDDVTVPVPTRTGPVPTHLADKSRADMDVMRSVVRAGAGAMPVYHCLGNHDCNLPREEVCETLGNPKNAPYFSVKLPRGWRLLVLDTTEVNPRYETPGSDAQVAGEAFVESAKSKPGKFI